ncbi:MAG: replicative DNA helicase [Clostridiales bacterium]|nr:replicative DNA helicase [Clostridiales bacterium]
MSDKINVMPNNLDAEQALLGCMLIDNEILADVLDKLVAEDFYQESHQYILSAMKIVFAERKPVDIVTLADKLDLEKNLEKAGGIAYITELAQIIPSAANYEHYLEIVKRDATNRNLIRAARDIIKYSMESDDSLKSVQFSESLIYNISKTNDTSTMKDIRESDGIDLVLEKFQKLAEDKDAYRGIPTGFTRLDKLTNGLQKSDLIVLAARPGMGKTSLAMNIVESAALKYDKVCAVFSLEMPEVQIIQRLLCSFAGVSMKDALSGDLKPNDWKKIVQASEKLRKSRINIDDSSRVTPAEILSKCRRIKAKNNGRLDLVMIDYIQLMSSGRNNKGEENRTQEVATITRELKIMAKELDVPVIALSQLRRMQTKEPQLTDLRESGAIEQDADIVMFINRPDVTATEEEMKKNNIVKGMADLIIAKHRNGGLDRIKLRFKGELTKFVNPEPNDEIEEPNYDRAPIPDEVPPEDNDYDYAPPVDYDIDEDPFN